MRCAATATFPAYFRHSTLTLLPLRPAGATCHTDPSYNWRLHACNVAAAGHRAASLCVAGDLLLLSDY